MCVHKNLQNLRARNRKFTEVLMIRKGLGGMLAEAGNYAGTLLLTTQKPQINPYKPCKKSLELLKPYITAVQNHIKPQKNQLKTLNESLVKLTLQTKPTAPDIREQLPDSTQLAKCFGLKSTGFRV